MELLYPSLGYFVWALLAFLIMFIILRVFAWKPILSSLKERETGIANALAAAEQAKQEVASLKNENEYLLAKAREERTKMLKEAKEVADKMVADAQAKAKSEYERIVADAQLAIAQQKNQALVEVKNKVGNLVIEVAEKVLRKQLENKVAEENYINELVKEVKLN